MIVYRTVSEREISGLFGNECGHTAPRGKNTFKYDRSIGYKHFFYFYDSAVLFMKTQNKDTYYNKYALILAYEIDSEILEKYFGFGKYYIKGCHVDDKVLNYLEYIYYPEFAIPEELITNKMIIGIGNENRITPVNSKYFYDLYSIMNVNQEQYLEYLKDLFYNEKDSDVLYSINNKRKELFPL